MSRCGERRSVSVRVRLEAPARIAEPIFSGDQDGGDAVLGPAEIVLENGVVDLAAVAGRVKLDRGSPAA